MRDEYVPRAARPNPLGDERPVGVGHLEAVLVHQRLGADLERDARRAQDVDDERLADLVGALGVEVDLVDGAAGGEDLERHGRGGVGSGTGGLNVAGASV